MGKKELVRIIGNVLTNSKFRQKFRQSVDSTFPKTGLTEKEKEFLRDNKMKFVDYARQLGVAYEGENKTRR